MNQSFIPLNIDVIKNLNKGWEKREKWAETIKESFLDSAQELENVVNDTKLIKISFTGGYVSINSKRYTSRADIVLTYVLLVIYLTENNEYKNLFQKYRNAISRIIAFTIAEKLFKFDFVGLNQTLDNFYDTLDPNRIIPPSTSVNLTNPNTSSNILTSGIAQQALNQQALLSSTSQPGIQNAPLSNTSTIQMSGQGKQPKKPKGGASTSQQSQIINVSPSSSNTPPPTPVRQGQQPQGATPASTTTSLPVSAQDIQTLSSDISGLSGSLTKFSTDLSSSLSNFSRASIVSQLTNPTADAVLKQLSKQLTSNAFNIEDDIKLVNDYILSRIALKESIDYNIIQQVRRKYPFIMTDEYERNILGYNGIINTGIVSNIPVNYKDLVLPIPSYTQNIPDQKDKQVQLNLKQAIDRGYQIVSSKDGFKNDYITFKQKEGQNKFVGSYIHPKLKGKFRVRYEGKNNTFVISNPNYPTGYVKTGFQIYSYLNSLLKKQEKESQKPFVYMPRIAVAYQ